MSPTETPALSLLERKCVIEVDAFCTGCHYNLHGQIVTIDDRLGIPVCRCPECGKFHPAGTGVTASGVWLRRFASILLITWILMVLGLLCSVGLLLGGLSAGSVGMYEYTRMIAPNGAEVEFAAMGKGGLGYVYKGTGTLAAQFKNVGALHPWHDDPNTDHPGLAAMVGLCVGSLLLGVIAGTLGVTLLWHWPRWRYFWLLLIPLVPAVVVTTPFRIADEFQQIRTACVERVFFQTAVQCLGVLIGILLGRMISRTIVRVIIPPRPRQALAFLWLVDGKKPPAV